MNKNSEETTCYYTTKPTYVITNAISVPKKTKENKGKGACRRFKKHTHTPTQTHKQECDSKKEHNTVTAEVRFSH